MIKNALPKVALLAFFAPLASLANEEPFKFLGADMRAWVEGTSLDKIDAARVGILVYFGPIDADTETEALNAFAQEAQKLSDNVVGTLIDVYPVPDERSKSFLRELKCWGQEKLVNSAEPVLFFTFATFTGRSCVASFGTPDRFARLMYDLRDLEEADCLGRDAFQKDADHQFYEMKLAQDDGAPLVAVDQIMKHIARMKEAHCS